MTPSRLQSADGGYTPSVSEQREYWDERWNKNALPNGYQIGRGNEILSLIRSLNLTRPQILDYGCGTGWFTEQLSHLGIATGIDLSDAAIGWARRQYPHVNFMAGNLYETSLDRQRFDIVVSQEVVAHVEDQHDYLNHIVDALKPGGYLVITTANKFVIDRWEQERDPDAHIKKWLTMGGLKQLLRSRFEILRTGSKIVLGDKGILRIINSYKLNELLAGTIGRDHVERLKERLGLGYCLIVLARLKR